MLTFRPYASSSSGNLYSLSDGHTDLLIECGVTYKQMQMLLPKAPSEYAACVYSHSHSDHFRRDAYTELTRRGVEVVQGSYCRGGDLYGTIRAKSFDVKHDVLNCGYIFQGACGESCIFIIDTFYSPGRPKTSPAIVAIECNYARDLMKPGDSLNDRLFASHMELGQCIETLKSWDLSRTREIHLLHLSDSRSDEARFVREVREATGIPTYAAPKIRMRHD